MAGTGRGQTPLSVRLRTLYIFNSGLVHEDLRLFLETSLPKSGKKQKITLGIGESKLASAVGESLGVQCQFTGVVPEIIRGEQYWETIFPM